MHTRSIRQRFVGGVTALIVLSLLAIPATADHSWNGYHWERKSNPFTLQVGDNVTSAWDPYLMEAIGDWNQSVVLDLERAAGGTKPKPCKATRGRIEVCNANYGGGGWLGVATVWISGKHITQATAKMNDYYFNKATYNTPEWRRHVICQEIAHAFGLDHQDEDHDNANLGSCMDYTDDPDGPPSNEHPNKHDYEELESIYSHADEGTTIGASPTDTAAAEEPNPDDRSTWGKVIRRDGRGQPSLYRKDLGNAEKVFTFVISADEAQGPTVGDGTGDGGRNDGGKKDDRKQDGGKHHHGKHHQ